MAMRARPAPVPLEISSPQDAGVNGYQDDARGAVLAHPFSIASPSRKPCSPLASPLTFQSPRLGAFTMVYSAQGVDFGSPQADFDSSVPTVASRSRTRGLDGLEEMQSRACPPVSRSPLTVPSPSLGTPQHVPGHVWFNFKMNSSSPITPYSEIYGQHPRLFHFDDTGVMHPASPMQKGLAVCDVPTVSMQWETLPQGFNVPYSPNSLASNGNGNSRPGSAAGGTRPVSISTSSPRMLLSPPPSWSAAPTAAVSPTMPSPPGALLGAQLGRPSSSSGARQPRSSAPTSPALLSPAAGRLRSPIADDLSAAS